MRDVSFCFHFIWRYSEVTDDLKRLDIALRWHREGNKRYVGVSICPHSYKPLNFMNSIKSSSKPMIRPRYLSFLPVRPGLMLEPTALDFGKGLCFISSSTGVVLFMQPPCLFFSSGFVLF